MASWLPNAALYRVVGLHPFWTYSFPNSFATAEVACNNKGFSKLLKVHYTYNRDC